MVGVLRWEQTGKLESRLYSGEAEIASLSWASRHGSLATGLAQGKSWTFKRAGFLRPRVTVRDTGSSIDAAVLTLGWRPDGTVTFSDGEAFHLKRSGVLHPKWSISDTKGRELLMLVPKMGLRRVECEVAVEKEVPRTLLLATLGWYVILLTSHADYDVAGSTAAVMAATSA